MIFSELLAKSRQPGKPLLREQTLCGHIEQVLLAGDRLVFETGEDQLLALGLNSRNHLSKFRNLVRVATLLHDVGKANNHFQEMVRKKRSAQGIRHEWVSVLMVVEALGEWIEKRVSKADLRLSVWAVAGHHPGWNRHIPPKPAENGAGPEIEVFWDHPDLKDCLNLAACSLDLGPPPLRERTVYQLTGNSSVFNLLQGWFRDELAAWKEMPQEDRKLLAALKHTLVGADVAGSALPAFKLEPKSSTAWISTAFGNKPSPHGLEAVANRRLCGAIPRPFQVQMGDSSESITLVTAGCGSGKTVGAYLWAARQHPYRKLFFCYPTTGTATEGFRGYLHVNGVEDFSSDSEAVQDLQADLFHSRRDIDFEAILGTDPDPDDGDAGRVESLKAWSTPVVACTCDTVLGVVQNHRRGMFAWPGMAKSAVIFDEVHAYDERLFGALLRFLRDVPGVPVMLMTASLPDGRLAAIRHAANESSRSLRELSGPPDAESLPRYRLEDTPPDLKERIGEELMRGGKILWVSNTVNRVMDIADRYPGAIVYHSRFKYIDRVQRHREVVGAFDPRQSHEPALACCTQVAEMSLDLKGCTLLVTDLAPVPAMIQRLGRLNRDAGPGSPVRAFIVLETPESLPYETHDLEEAGRWLKKLVNRNLSQNDLVTEWKAIENPREPLPVASAWLDGGPRTQPNDLREASPGVTVLLESDTRKLEAKGGNPGVFAIPMPSPPKFVDWRSRQYKGIPVVQDETIAYDTARGARWKK